MTFSFHYQRNTLTESKCFDKGPKRKEREHFLREKVKVERWLNILISIQYPLKFLKIEFSNFCFFTFGTKPS